LDDIEYQFHFIILSIHTTFGVMALLVEGLFSVFLSVGSSFLPAQTLVSYRTKNLGLSVTSQVRRKMWWCALANLFPTFFPSEIFSSVSIFTSELV
jgi:short subunit fatty acids transporter